MKKIKTYNEFTKNKELLMPCNYRLMQKLHFSGELLSYYWFCEKYQCLYNHKNYFYKPLNLF
jgi:hypothetical protein